MLPEHVWQRRAYEHSIVHRSRRRYRLPKSHDQRGSGRGHRPPALLNRAKKMAVHNRPGGDVERLKKPRCVQMAKDSERLVSALSPV